MSRETLSRYIFYSEARGKLRGLDSVLFLSFFSCIFPVSPGWGGGGGGINSRATRETRSNMVLPVEPKSPRGMQRQRFRLVFSVFLCDILQLFLVDINVVLNRLSAQGSSVPTEVRLTRGNRHYSRHGANLLIPAVWIFFMKTPGLASFFFSFLQVPTHKHTQPLFRLPTGDVSASLGRNVSVGPTTESRK